MVVFVYLSFLLTLLIISYLRSGNLIFIAYGSIYITACKGQIAAAGGRR